MNRRSIFRLLAADSVAAPVLVAPALVAPDVADLDIGIGIEPPAPRYEVVPAARPGYLWAPGVWTWNGSKHL